MILKDITLPTPPENILYDEVLLDLAEKGQANEALRFWESKQTFIVLGRTGKVADDIHEEAVYRDRIPVLRRASGGGTVLQGPGCLNYSLILSKERHPELSDIRRSFRSILEKIISAMNQKGFKADTSTAQNPVIYASDGFAPLSINPEQGRRVDFRPLSDIVIGPDERKCSGNAQRRGKRYILHHGTLLYRMDLSLVGRYLTMPREAPEYRQGRSHHDFVTNILCSQKQLKRMVLEAFPVKTHEPSLSALEEKQLKLLLQTREVTLHLKEFLQENSPHGAQTIVRPLPKD